MKHENRIVLDGIELKPCPFCGEYVRFDVSFAEISLFTGECPGCGMKFEYQENVSLNAWMLDEPFDRVAGLPCMKNSIHRLWKCGTRERMRRLS